MRRYLPWISFSLVLALAAPVTAADEKKDAKDKKDTAPAAKDKKDAYDKMVTAGELAGKLVNWGEANQKYFTLRVNLKYQVPNVGAIQNIANLKNQLAQIAANPNLNPADRARQMQQTNLEIAKNQVNAMSIKDEWINVDLEAGADLKVRVNDPAPVFDDKGNLRRPTAKELKEFKGDPKLPGYAAELSALGNDQLVKVYLAPQKKGTARPSAKDKDKDKDDKIADNKPQVVMILILSEPKK